MDGVTGLAVDIRLRRRLVHEAEDFAETGIGYMRCLSANCAEWRAANPVPEPDGREHGYSRTALIELAREMRQPSAAHGLGSLGLVGGA